MNTTFLAMSASIIIGLGLLVTIGALSMLSGTLNFLFVRPKFNFLKSQFGDNGLAFSYRWDQSAEPVKFSSLRLQLFNPFGNPSQIEITREFDPIGNDFVKDLELGSQLKEILNAKGLDKSTLEIKLISKDGITQQLSMKGDVFKKKYKEAKQTIDDVQDQFVAQVSKSKYEVPERTFISPPLPKGPRALKLATNPEFAGQFSGSVDTSATNAVANFSVSKVWIEPGCIVCDACEGIYPEVFEVTDSTCIIRPGAPLNDGLKIQESAEACPVEVIKFTKVG